MVNMKLNFRLIAHGQPKDVKDRDKNVIGQKVQCLFVRDIDSDLGEVMNTDGTFPSCDVLDVRLDLDLFKSVDPKKSVCFICDSYAISGNELVVARRIKVGSQFISLKKDDVSTDRSVSST